MSYSLLNRTRAGQRWAVACFIAVAVGSASAQNLTNLNLQFVSKTSPVAGTISYGDVWAENDIACLGVWLGYSANNYGVGIFSISNPTAPALLSVYSPNPTSQNQFELGALRNRIGYFGSWSGGGLHIVSLTNPAAPQLLSRIGATTGNVTNGFDRVHTVFLERNYLYEAAHVTGIVSVKVFDVSNPFAPVYLQDIVTTNTTKVHQITVRNKGAQVILYTSGWGGNDNGAPASPGQTDIWDVTAVGSQPAQWLGRVFSGYNSHSSWPTDDGNTLIVCRETPGGDVKFYDISNPAAIPTNAAPFVMLKPGSMGLEADIPHNPVVVSNFLFVSWYQNGIQVFDITDVTKPVRVGFYDTFPGAKTSSYQGNWGVFPDLGFTKILLSDIQSGLFVLNGTALLTPANNYPPLIVKQPASLTATQGSAVAFTPTVTGSSLAYQWQFNGANLPDATSSNLTLLNVQAAQAGPYTLVASNATAVVTSSVASLSVVIPQGAPSIPAQPQNVSVYQEEDATFSVAATGSAPLAYQWQFNDAAILNATNNSYTRPHVQPEDVGFYSVVVSNAAGVAVSSNALLTLLDSPYLSAVQAAAGSHGALISWNTIVPGDSQVQFSPATMVMQNLSAGSAAQSGFGSSSYVDPGLTTNHVILLSGLSPGTRYSYQTFSRAGTNTYLSGVYQFTTAGTLILDNPAGAYTGAWTTGNSSADKYSTNYHFATTVGGGATATATWRPNITTPGKYDVSVWYPQGANRANNAPFQISFNGGSTNVLVNQQTGGGAWQLIAAGVDFAKGTNGFVRLANNANASVVIADAVRFDYVTAQDFPTNSTVPTWWRDFFFGGSTDASADPDGDGYTTAQEFVMGTTPTNNLSHLQLAATTSNTTASVTFWPLHQQRSYQLLMRPEIGSPGWNEVSSIVLPTEEGSGVMQTTMTNSAQNFYRLRVRMNPNGDASLLSFPVNSLMTPLIVEENCGPYRVYVR